MKKCSKCKEIKPLDEFNNKTSTKDGKQPLCRLCSKATYKNYYDNTPKEKARLLANNAAALALATEEVNKRKDKPCVDCGIKYPPYVMDFDHIGTDKQFNVSDALNRKSVRLILAEIEKCELVCANCHRIRTYSRRMA